jgi:hypothetical protein
MSVGNHIVEANNMTTKQRQCREKHDIAEEWYRFGPWYLVWSKTDLYGPRRDSGHGKAKGSVVCHENTPDLVTLDVPYTNR